MKRERNQKGQDIQVDPELAKDPNYIAYKEQEAFLKENFMGKWVAFVDGKLVATEAGKEDLFKKIRDEHLNLEKSVYIHEIVEVEPVYNIEGSSLDIIED